MSPISKYHLKPKVVISGAAESHHCGQEASKKAMAIGRELAKRHCIVVTGATTGIPYWAAKGAKEAGGFVVGLSPAASEREHVRKYHLPIDYHDLIIYTGFEYAGRNLLLTRTGDGIISICGRMGTINEFTIAFEEKKPLAVLEGNWDTDDLIKEIVAKAHRGSGHIIYEKDPKALITKLLARIEQARVKNHHFAHKHRTKLPDEE